MGSAFYGASDAEVSDFEEGDFIELISSVKAVGTPRPLSDEERKLNTLNKEYNQTQKDWADTDKIGSQTVPTDHRASELYQKSTDGFVTEASTGKKIRAGQSGFKGQFKLVTYTEMPYQRANVYADGYAAIIDLPIRMEKFFRNGWRLTVIADYLNKKAYLERIIRNQNRRVVPPKPQTIVKAVGELQKYGRITADPAEKIKVQAMLRQIELIWEESNAFWKNRK